MPHASLPLPLVSVLRLCGALCALVPACSTDDPSPPGTHAGSSAGGSASSGNHAGGGNSGGKTSAGASNGGIAGSGEGGNANQGGEAGDGIAGDGGGGDPNPPGDFGALGLNDVSYLFPVPRTDTELQSLLRFDSAGPNGALLPRATYDTIIDHLAETLDAERSYAMSHVVALRLDPCPSHLSDSTSACTPEVRLSTQLADNPDGFWDGGVHLVYRLPRAELDTMLRELLAAKPANQDLSALPLGPHPILAEQGLLGSFATELKRVVLAHVGGAKLVKVTTVITGRSGDDWFLTQYEKSAAGFVQTRIPSTTTDVIQFHEQASNPIAERNTILSDIDPKVGYPLELADSEAAKKLPRSSLEQALTRLTQLENPDESSFDTVDCVSCHLTANARDFYQKLTKVTVSPRYQAPAGLDLTRHDGTELSGRATRAFGYMGDLVAISQRTINESARVVSWFSHGTPSR